MVELAVFWSVVLAVAAVASHLRDELEHHDRAADGHGGDVDRG